MSSDRPRLTIGLTGGLASGKSAVSDLFRRLGVPVVDADVVAREVVEPGEPALAEIVKEFGTEVLDADGRLDRRQLRERAFAAPRRRKHLERILHSRIRRRMDEQRLALRGPYCVLCIPLLLETKGTETVDRVLVVDAPEESQVERAMERDGSTRETIERIMRAQMSRSRRLEQADDIVRNDADLAHLQEQVEQLHRRYLVLAGQFASH